MSESAEGPKPQQAPVPDRAAQITHELGTLAHDLFANRFSAPHSALDGARDNLTALAKSTT